MAVTILTVTGCSTSNISKSQHKAEPAHQIYDAQADGEEQLATALAIAGREQKRVLLNLGANWCSDSHGMYRLLHDDPTIARELARYYVFTMVDVNERGETPRNIQLLSRFADPLGRGIPVLLVVAPDGTLLNTEPTERLADVDHANPEKVLKYLRTWATHPLPGP